MTRLPRLRRLTVFLLKAGTSREAAMRERDGVEAFVVPPLDTELESLFVAAREAHPPWWAGFLDAHIAGGDLDDCAPARQPRSASDRAKIETRGDACGTWREVRQEDRSALAAVE